MRILFCHIEENIDPSQLQAAIALLPEERRAKALKYHFERDQYLCAKSYLLLKQGLLEEYGITSVPEWTYGEHGKPLLKDFPNIHFNLSHCRKGAVCAIDSKPVGIDIERILFKKELASFVLNDNELEQVLNAPDKSIAFTTFWTMKESYLKLTGTGLVSDLKGLLNETVMQKVHFDTTVDMNSGFVMTTAHYISSNDNASKRK